MEYWLWAVIFLLTGTLCLLLIKIYFLRKSAKEIDAAFKERLYIETNTLIGISSRDSAMRHLAASVNDSLRTLRQKRRQYENGDLALKEAVTNISHDLRTPLTAIYGYLDLLSHEEKSDAAAHYIAQIENCAEALSNLTDELFRYSVLASVNELTLKTVNLKALLEESLISFYGAMQKRGMTPTISLPDTPVFCRLNKDLVSRIFDNIINNALKYSDGDLSVTMDLDGLICFSNTAKNLNPITAGRLFERYYTVSSGCSQTGLGLSIAKLLTEKMGGTIKAVWQDGRLNLWIKF